MKGYEKSKTDTKEVDLPKEGPVELRYETILVQDGNVIVYRDVYERGTNTEENLRKVLEAYGINFDQLSENERKQLLDALGQMAVDATGQAVEEPANTNTNKRNGTSSKVTRNIKGKKEVAVPIAALKGKGYPLPLDLADK